MLKQLPARKVKGVTRLPEAIKNRYLDLLGSIYIYNEHRGYTALDRVIEAARARDPDNHEFLGAIAKHRADERKHYEMFKRWFELRGIMPYEIGRAYGHIDRFIEIIFGKTIDNLDTRAVIASDDLFEKLARIISLTEKRGFRQVAILLRSPVVRSDTTLTRIFTIIERDEPSHWQPYDAWLTAQKKRPPNLWERLVDQFIHSELLFLKLPLLFLSKNLPRRTEWADSKTLKPKRG
jgi:hypothetical protein